MPLLPRMAQSCQIIWISSSCASVMSMAVSAVQDKLVSAVCHGPAAFTEAELNGKPLVKDKKVAPGDHTSHRLVLLHRPVLLVQQCKVVAGFKITSEPEECAGD
jgi:putative intracellular protease/amidase